MEIVISIVVGLVILFVIYAVFSAVLSSFIKQHPKVKWILLGIVVIIACYSFWTGIVIGIILLRWFIHLENNGWINQCAHCGSYNTEITKEDHSIKIWECNKCNNITCNNK